MRFTGLFVSFVGLCQLARAWDCPKGYGDPTECQQANFGSCFDDKVKLGSGPECVSEGARMGTFDHRQYGQGAAYEGCGVDTGYWDYDCCNCWRLRKPSHGEPEVVGEVTSEDKPALRGAAAADSP
mmetsp:Transcript_87091/g.251552  ORF Transcript_87091/g.251552 Transcript_87091/m.251552 type:complete len:126 (-) Transcript_87091:225-602(-)